MIKLPEKLECKRCGWRWYPKEDTVPKICSHCKSKYWNANTPVKCGRKLGYKVIKKPQVS